MAKSPHSAYRLATEFKGILQASEDAWRSLLKKWSASDAKRERLAFQAKLEEETARNVERKHADLIAACIEHYVPRFLSGYVVLYTDDADGDRISVDEQARLKAAGVELTLGDAMPDVLLWNADNDRIWVIEAVTSDGEVDQHKVDQITRLVERTGKSGVDFTTAYDSWGRAAARQKRHKNIAPGTYLWIVEDPSKHFLAAPWPVSDGA